MKAILAALCTAAGLSAAMPAAQAADELLNLSCRGGGSMTFEEVEDMWLIRFERGSPTSQEPLAAGHCAFADKHMDGNMIGMLVIDKAMPNAALAVAAVNGGTFEAVVERSIGFTVKSISKVNVVDAAPLNEEPADPEDANDDVAVGGDGGLCAATEATVSIPEPNLKKLNVRTKPGGKVVAQIPEGKVVTVVGPCGAEAAAGLVAQKNKASDWCQIDVPAGCVMAKYLDFDGGLLDDAAGLTKKN